MAGSDIPQAIDPKPQDEGKQGGRLYHLSQNLKLALSTRLRALLKSRKFYALGALVIILLFFLRATFHHVIMLLRGNTFVGVYSLFLIVAGYAMLRSKLQKRWSLPILFVALAFGVLLFNGGQAYLALYFKYNRLNKIELSELPLTDLETPQPLNSVYVLANETISETNAVSVPDRVLIDGQFRWVMEITPAYFSAKWFGKVRELYNVSATSPSPNFSAREKVSFDTGEGLVWSRNAYQAVIKRLGPFKYLNYYPADVRYLKNDQGKWVQVVSLARWQGLLFPSLEFGGVTIIEQHEKGHFLQECLRSLTRIVIGQGRFIPAHEIGNYPYLKGQNIMPHDVSRNIAMAYRFQSGFSGPLPGFKHEGDIRIPDLDVDMNPQPFTLFFREVKEKEGLFHYFGLEPFTQRRHGLNTSLFIPGDGHDGAVYFYNHSKKKEALTGSSAISSKIIESKKNYDWSKNRPVEARPYLKDIHGKRRFYWLCTIATINEEGNMAGSVPDLVITDAQYSRPVWVETNQGSDYWQEQIATALDLVYQEEQ